MFPAVTAARNVARRGVLVILSSYSSSVKSHYVFSRSLKLSLTEARRRTTVCHGCSIACTFHPNLLRSVGTCGSRRCCFKIFLILSSDGHLAQWSGIIYENFGRRSKEKHLCEVPLNLDLWFRRICHLEKMFTHHG